VRWATGGARDRLVAGRSGGGNSGGVVYRGGLTGARRMQGCMDVERMEEREDGSSDDASSKCRQASRLGLALLSFGTRTRPGGLRYWPLLWLLLLAIVYLLVLLPDTDDNNRTGLSLPHTPDSNTSPAQAEFQRHCATSGWQASWPPLPGTPQITRFCRPRA